MQSNGNNIETKCFRTWKVWRLDEITEELIIQWLLFFSVKQRKQKYKIENEKIKNRDIEENDFPEPIIQNAVEGGREMGSRWQLWLGLLSPLQSPTGPHLPSHVNSLVPRGQGVCVRKFPFRLQRIPRQGPELVWSHSGWVCPLNTSFTEGSRSHALALFVLFNAYLY